MSSVDQIDSRPAPDYKQYRTVYSAPQVMESAKDEDGAALQWADYQAMARAHNDTLALNQSLWSYLIRKAEASTGISATVVTLKSAGLDS